jgi:malonyl-CoA decarboxylase
MNDQPKAGFLDRTLANLRRTWREIAGDDDLTAAADLGPDLPDEDMERLRRQMVACLESRGGEVTARARAAALGRAYLGLSTKGRERFLAVLADDFDVDPEAVLQAMERVRQAGDPETATAARENLRRALVAPRVRLLTQFNALPEGVKFLVDMRAELLRLARKNRGGLAGLEGDIRELLASWFDVGFLELQRITWESPAALLEKLIAYEAVHAIRSWQDLKNRLDSDRRCFAFFHPRMRNEPLIFVEVALVDGLAGNVQALLDENAPVTDPRRADTAIFYSISNAQKGLAGISFGNFLIKRVVDELAREFKNLKTFSTLSPIPGFRAWLEGALAEGEPGLFKPAERKALAAAAQRRGPKGTLKAVLARPDWHRDEALAEALRAPLLRLCARFLGREKREGSKALDPVAHFHLTNGARIERINWLGDTSAKGIEQSAGMMVNYLYKLDDIDANHEAYTGRGEIAVSGAVKGLLKG